MYLTKCNYRCKGKRVFFSFLVKSYMCVTRKNLFIFFFIFFHLQEKTQETPRNPPKLHSKSIIPPYIHAKLAQERNHHPKSFKKLRRNDGKQYVFPVATSRVATVTLGKIVVFSSFVKFKPSSVLYWAPQTSQGQQFAKKLGGKAVLKFIGVQAPKRYVLYLSSLDQFEFRNMFLDVN